MRPYGSPGSFFKVKCFIFCSSVFREKFRCRAKLRKKIHSLFASLLHTIQMQFSIDFLNANSAKQRGEVTGENIRTKNALLTTS